MKRKGRGPGKNNLPLELRARRQSGPHRAAPPDRIARVQALVDAGGLSVIGGMRVAGPILRGQRSVGLGRLEKWEQQVQEQT